MYDRFGDSRCTRYSTEKQKDHARLDYFIVGSTILVIASLLEVVITSSHARTGRLERARASDRWSSWLFPAISILFSVQALLNPLGM